MAIDTSNTLERQFQETNKSRLQQHKQLKLHQQQLKLLKQQQELEKEKQRKQQAEQQQRQQKELEQQKRQQEKELEQQQQAEEEEKARLKEQERKERRQQKEEQRHAAAAAKKQAKHEADLRLAAGHIQVEFEEFDPEDSLKRKQYAAEKKLAEKSYRKEELRRKDELRKLEEAKEEPVEEREEITFVAQTRSSVPVLDRVESFTVSPKVESHSKSQDMLNSFSLKSTRYHAPSSKANEAPAKEAKPPGYRVKAKVDKIKQRFEGTESQESLVPRKKPPTASETKAAKDRDREVGVYLETVRQRTVRDKQQVTPELFQQKPVEPSKQITASTTKSAHNKPSSQETGLPSVRKLLARFETGHSSSALSTTVSQPSGLNTSHLSGSPIITPSSRSRREDRYAKRAMSADNLVEAGLEPEAAEAMKPLESPPLVYNTGQEPTTKSSNIRKWDPLTFVKSLYILPALEEPEGPGDDGPVSLDGSHSCPSIEGYMDKLPAGRKRPTLWNSWKKHYFVARNGILHIYASKSQTELIEKLELFGGQIDFMDSNMLGMEDRRGQYVVVRCATHKAAQEWESALSFHTMENYAKTFISPSPIPHDLKSTSNVIVVDLGGASIRAGICGPSPYLPTLFFPSLMAVNPDNHHEKYFGFDALKPEIRKRFEIYSPLLPSKNIDKYSIDLVALCGLLLKVFKELRVDPKKSELQLSVPRNFNDKTKIAIAALLFDEFEVRAVNMGHQSVFTLHSYSTDTGIVVDIGERMDVVPIVSGYKVQSGLSRSTTGGMEMCSHMRHSLLGRNYSLTSFLDMYIVRQVVERLGYIARNFDAELENFQGEEKTLNLNEGSRIASVVLGVERFQVTEGLFKPELWGLDQAGIHVLVKKAITECSLDMRKEVSQSIFLSGGLSLIPGFKHRLEVELGKILPLRPRVHASPYRYHAAFLGASAHAANPAFHAAKVTRDQWVAGKADIAKAWVL